ncbi:MAG TPA: acyl carrier protein [Polyangiaceae bacterium]|jgi:acyl carrier protein
MRSPSYELVRRTIVRHAGVPARHLHPWLRLDADLDLTPLELVLIATEIEEALGVELPVEDLAPAETVGDVLRFFRRALAERKKRAGSSALVVDERRIPALGGAGFAAR